jgi:hypothetical protein
MPFYEKGNVRIRYEEAGSGFPLLLTPGGGLNSRVSNWSTAVFNSMEIFKDEFRCITMDQRNANGGGSTGPVPARDGVDRPLSTTERRWCSRRGVVRQASRLSGRSASPPHVFAS